LVENQDFTSPRAADRPVEARDGLSPAGFFFGVNERSQTDAHVHPASGIEINLVEMTGLEEDLLTSRRLMKNGEAIDHVLHNATGLARRPSDAISVCARDLVFVYIPPRARGVHRKTGYSSLGWLGRAANSEWA